MSDVYGWARALQAEHALWLRGGYPGGQDPREPLLGLVVEAGEAAHALLDRHKARVHGPNPRHPDPTAELLDALGDCAVYACSWCNAAGVRFETLWGFDAPTSAEPDDDLETGILLVQGAAACFETGRVVPGMLEALDLVARCEGSDLRTLTGAAWAQVRGRVR